MTRRHRLALLALAVACALAVSACGSGAKPTPRSTEASKPASKILADAQRAVTNARSVHFAGHGTQQKQAITLDLTISSGSGSDGKFGLFGGNVEVIKIGPSLYVRGDSTFWKRFEGNSVKVGSIANKWVKVPATLQTFQGLVGLMSMAGVSSRLGVQGQVVNEGLKTYNGQQVIALRDTAENGTLYLKDAPRPYPVALAGGKSAVTITFDHWNQPVSIPGPPKNAISVFGG